ncbi:L7Ae/L30e/S12e/Gadd45 family ribosomal protein [Mesoplasma melaleucae]|uniref:50S ribosomal protein L7ae n=1 Tax=Mesoplasma melaleucae TaxID=81459 RepID=A0A2K8NW59_9MOLU|nr:ribosomal L7Ae/L30e/S12e/Gadd45 family protein [Mesoplasma melaleucae]ATZ17974.1 50S ribosomal protein L7ae [Mesoplasma melaleucae]
MNKTKLLNAIGLAYNSAKLIKGKKLLESIKKNKVKYVILTTNMGASQKKKFSDKCKFYNIEFIDDVLSFEELSQACGSTTIVAIGVNDINIIKLIKNNL